MDSSKTLMVRRAFKAGRDSRDDEVTRLKKEIDRLNVLRRDDLIDLQDDADRQAVSDGNTIPRQ